MSPLAGVRARGGRWLVERRGAVAILLYHRVARPRRDPQQLSVTPEHFDEHLAVIRDLCTPVALGDVPRLLRARRPPRRAVAVSFDDGYRDNLLEAKPLLEQRDVAATVFVSSGYVGTGREFWWDELERLVLDRDDPDDYHRLQAQLRPASLANRDRILAGLRVRAGEPPEGSAREDYLCVDHDELARLDGGAVEVGSHTRHHLSLAAQPLAVQEEEVAGGSAEIGEWLGRRVRLFAYPFGSPSVDVSADTRRIARRTGHDAAVVNDPRLCTVTTSRHALPRFLVRNWPAEQFATWLEQEVFGA